MEIAGALERIKAAVGPRGWIADPAEQEPYLTEARRLWRGATRLVVPPSVDGRGRGGGADLCQVKAADRAAWREYWPRRRRRPLGGWGQHCGGARPHEPYSRDRSCQFHNDRRGGVHP